MRTRVVAVILAGAWLGGGQAAAQDTAADRFRAGPDTYAPRYDPARQPPVLPPAAVPYGVLIDPAAPRPGRLSAADSSQTAAASRGYLSLFVQPVTAQIYVDGFFLGTIEDYRGVPGPLIDAGPHRVELRAVGYETAAFDIRIVAGGVVTLRDDLVLAGTPAPASAPTRPAGGRGRTFYVIPRCYAGDTPPTPAHLPAGCDPAAMRTVLPSEIEGPPGAGIAAPRPRTGER
jgi:hypothetical protein